MLSAVPLAQRAALLAAARQHQPYLSMSVWLRRSLTMDITPGRGLGIVPGTEEDHAVPVPLGRGPIAPRGGVQLSVWDDPPEIDPSDIQ